MCLDTQHHLFQMYWLKGLKHKIKKNNSVIKTQLSFCLKLNFPDKKLKYHFFLTFFQLLFFFFPHFQLLSKHILNFCLKTYPAVQFSRKQYISVILVGTQNPDPNTAEDP